MTDQRVLGYIEGYVRRFWQQRDHKPTNSKPSTVWGAAYHIPASHAEEVHAYLDDREIDGYTVHFTPFYAAPSATTTTNDNSSSTANNGTSQTPPITCMVYIGLPTNTQFLRNPADRDPDNIARVISQSCGQSGENREYLYLLEKALEGPEFSRGVNGNGDGNGIGGVADSHVADLARRVRAIEGKDVSEVDRKRSEIVLEHLPGPELGREERPVRMEEFEGGDVDCS
ncbi:cation transporter ChaC [Histoplasma capsulatum var. duboisii H88]|uniref:glutathione-specific gamma-glutamylcyclotransferase n=1 Tax=Ajellomyces capsulatus (strain H88) TaxID=544711 RepID=F0UJD0_AJEC8|nr:cation transporter ChaC [Histoplasma capsulatum var. duboisii H88]